MKTIVEENEILRVYLLHPTGPGRTSSHIRIQQGQAGNAHVYIECAGKGLKISIYDEILILEDIPPECVKAGKIAYALASAAPEMLEALEKVNSAIIDGDLVWKNRRLTSDSAYHPANIKMCAAIAKAKGE
jgi:hypothetical protein